MPSSFGLMGFKYFQIKVKKVFTSFTNDFWFIFNPFQPLFHFYTSWKHQETYGFRGYRSGTLVENGLDGADLISCICNNLVNSDAKIFLKKIIIPYFGLLERLSLCRFFVPKKRRRSQVQGNAPVYLWMGL